jgi:hypothetical protein
LLDPQDSLAAAKPADIPVELRAKLNCVSEKPCLYLLRDAYC